MAPVAGRSFARRAWPVAAILGTLVVCGVATAQVVTYEGTAFPEPSPWERIATRNVQRSLENGWLTQTINVDERDEYSRSIGGIGDLVGRFFFEWRAITDNPSWLIDQWQVPTVVVAGGNAGVIYHVVMTESAAALLRDLNIPRVIVPISIGAPHTYRVEVFANEYLWYIDGIVADRGVPEGPYPDANAEVVWGAELTNDGPPPGTTAWDYVRLGRIPDDASGDYDSDGVVTLFDLYFFNDCLNKDGPGIFGGPGNDAGPGCRFADYDSDADVDLLDFAGFQNAFGQGP